MGYVDGFPVHLFNLCGFESLHLLTFDHFSFLREGMGFSPVSNHHWQLRLSESFVKNEVYFNVDIQNSIFGKSYSNQHHMCFSQVIFSHGICRWPMLCSAGSWMKKPPINPIQLEGESRSYFCRLCYHLSLYFS